jgi:GalNAc-alpha-(1->4)-GalNAc-alpha-(1->3)-diNAcBac-PP-undecaprenol alpha-1,4-N-acetyl-D-galactosaminyltransferase
MITKIKKKRIIFFLPVFRLGGASESIYKLSKFLIKKNFSILIISLGKNHYKNNLLKLGCEINEINSTRTLYSILKLRKIVKKEINKNFSKTILISNIHYANVISLIACRDLNGIEIILTERSSLSELKISSNPLMLLKNIVISLLVKYLYRYSDLIITNSQYEKKFIKEKFNVKKIKCIHPPSIYEVKKTFNKRIGKLKKNKIIYVGRLSKEKGVITILKALNNIKINHKFIFEIYGDGEDKNKVKKFIDLNKMNKFALIKGFKKNKKDIFKNAILFINASKFEGLPNAMVQSLNYNVYPICSNSPGGNMEVIKFGKLGLPFNTGDSDHLKDRIEFFFKKNLLLNNKIKFKHLKKYTEKSSNYEYLKTLNNFK